MQTLTIRAGSLAVADGLFSALDQFRPHMNRSDNGGGYDVTVAIGQNPDQLIAILNAVQTYVTERNDGPAVVELDGCKYSLEAG